MKLISVVLGLLGVAAGCADRQPARRVPDDVGKPTAAAGPTGEPLVRKLPLAAAQPSGSSILAPTDLDVEYIAGGYDRVRAVGYDARADMCADATWIVHGPERQCPDAESVRVSRGPCRAGRFDGIRHELVSGGGCVEVDPLAPKYAVDADLEVSGAVFTGTIRLKYP